MIFTRNFKIILSTFSCFLASVFSLLIFLLLSAPKPEILSFTIKDIYLEVGESTNIDYDINFYDAEIFFSISNSSIAKLDGNKVTAIGEGETYLRGSATYNGQVCYAGCNIIVTSPPKSSYHFEIVILSDNGSYFENNTIFMNNSLAFTISVYDDKNVLQDLTDIKFDTNFVQQEFKTFFISPNYEGVLVFELPSINYYFEIFVKNLNKIAKNG